MAYTVSGQSGVPSYGILEYIVNTDADVLTVPTDCASGSTIFVIGTAKVYMLSVGENGVKEWTLVGSESDS